MISRICIIYYICCGGYCGEYNNNIFWGVNYNLKYGKKVKIKTNYKYFRINNGLKTISTPPRRKYNTSTTFLDTKNIYNRRAHFNLNGR